MLKDRGHNILCDDRMFTIQKEGGFRIYGSWCHGTVPDSSSMTAPLRAIFFLEQSKENAIDLIEDKKRGYRNINQIPCQTFNDP